MGVRPDALEEHDDEHRAIGVPLGGEHFERTGGGVTEADLNTNVATWCEPWLDDQQSLAMAFLISRRMQR